MRQVKNSLDAGVGLNHFGQDVVFEGFGQDASPSANVGSPSFVTGNMRDLENMSKDEQKAWLEKQITDLDVAGKLHDGFNMAVLMDKIGLDVKANYRDGSYHVPLQAVMYAECVNLDIINKDTGYPDLYKLKNLYENGFEGTDADAIFKLNQMASGFCKGSNALSLNDTVAGRDVLAMFGAMDEASDFEWTLDPQQGVAENNPNTIAGLNAITMAVHPESPAKNYSVCVDGPSMKQAKSYMEMMEAIENGTFTTEMAREKLFEIAQGSDYDMGTGLPSQSIKPDGWNFQDHLDDLQNGFYHGHVMSGYMDNDGVEPVVRPSGSSEHVRPSGKPNDLGVTGSGTLSDFVGDALTQEGYENPVSHPNLDILEFSLGEDDAHVVDLQPSVGHQHPSTMPFCKNSNTAKPGERGQSVDELFETLNNRVAGSEKLAQTQQMGE